MCDLGDWSPKNNPLVYLLRPLRANPYAKGFLQEGGGVILSL